MTFNKILGGAFVACSLLLGGSVAHAGKVRLYNCSGESISVSAYDAKDRDYLASSSHKNIKKNKRGNLKCKTKRCQLSISKKGVGVKKSDIFSKRKGTWSVKKSGNSYKLVSGKKCG